MLETVCIPCRQGDCVDCSDVMRDVVNLPSICKCKRPGHNGEPRDAQIMDPETGTVYAPGLTVAQDGNVTYLEDDDA